MRASQPFRIGRNQAVRIQREFELPGEDAMSHHLALDLFKRTTVIALALDRRNVHNFSNDLCIDSVVLPVRETGHRRRDKDN
jgi:hypothetical protein